MKKKEADGSGEMLHETYSKGERLCVMLANRIPRRSFLLKFWLALLSTTATFRSFSPVAKAVTTNCGCNLGEGAKYYYWVDDSCQSLSCTSNLMYYGDVPTTILCQCKDDNYGNNYCPKQEAGSWFTCPTTNPNTGKTQGVSINCNKANACGTTRAWARIFRDCCSSVDCNTCTSGNRCLTCKDYDCSNVQRVYCYFCAYNCTYYNWCVVWKCSDSVYCGSGC